MQVEELEIALRRRPFEPFRLHVSDGTTYEVRHPELIMLRDDSAIVGVPGKKGPPRIASYEIVDLLHVVRLVPIDAKAAKK
jgi:hypothetical protein